jgi:diaminopimelate epimerase
MHGAGNDFIVTEESSLLNKDFISKVCNRRRGIGADGLILISAPSPLELPEQKTALPRFKMSYFNSDGGEAEMCGNGLRCAALYAAKYLTASNNTPILFETGAGLLKTELLDNGQVQIQIPILNQPQAIEIDNKKCFTVNTGVPHLVVPVDDLDSIDVAASGRKLRFEECFAPTGVNVDFISIPADKNSPVLIRTYERGVENETSACGTGIAASAVALGVFKSISSPITFMTQDKDIITIDFSHKENIVGEVENILLTGPSIEVFSGVWKECQTG